MSKHRDFVCCLTGLALLTAVTFDHQSGNVMHTIDDGIIYLPLVYVQTHYGFDDPLYDIQWGAHVMELPHIDDTEGPIIAVLDTGWDYTLPHQPRLVPGYDAIDCDNDPQSTEIHGIHIISLIGSQHDDAGIAGLCPQCRIMPVRVCENSQCSETDVVRGVQWAVTNGADVLNMAFGAYGDMPYFHTWGIDWALERGVIIVAGRGNGGTSDPFYPASYDGVISVAAIDASLGMPAWSNRGSDFVAPGVSVISQCATDFYCLGSGTSTSTAHVSGLAGYAIDRYDGDVYALLLSGTIALQHTYSNGLPTYQLASAPQ
jgi:subtilisin family serine protease